MSPGTGAVERVFREERGFILATLIRLLGGIDAAEEALAAAFEAALLQWPTEGVPDNPRAWLVRAGRTKRSTSFDAGRSSRTSEPSSKPRGSGGGRSPLGTP